MPWHNPDMPSIQLGVLKAFLVENGYNVDAKHLHLHVFKYIDVELFFSSHILNTLSCDHIYSTLILGKPMQKDKRNILWHFINAVNQLTHEILGNIKWDLYGLIGFTVTTVPQQFLLSLYLANMIKAKGIDKPIVFGGYICSNKLGLEILHLFSSIDFIINGEGEVALKELSDLIFEKKKNFSEIDGLLWRDKGKIMKNKDREHIAEMNELPIPEYSDFFELLNTLKEQDIKLPRKIFIPIESSRGCLWNKCSFCSHNLIWKGYRTKSFKRMLTEINQLSERYGGNDFYYVDNLCIEDENFWRKIIHNERKFNFYRVTYKSDISKHFLKIMQEAGVKEVGVGIESFGSPLLKKMNKGITAIQNIQFLKYCKECNIIPRYNVLVGFLDETEGDIREMIQIIDSLFGYHPPTLMECELRYGSPVYDYREAFEGEEKSICKKKFQGNDRFEIFNLLKPDFFRQKLKAEKSYDYAALRRRFMDWQIRYFHNKSLFFYQIKKDSLHIYDFRTSDSGKEFILRDNVKELYLYCDEIKNYEDIRQKYYAQYSWHSIHNILDILTNEKIIYREEDKFLSLAPFHPIMPKRSRELSINTTIVLGKV